MTTRVVLKVGGASTAAAAAPLRGLVTSCYEVAVVHGADAAEELLDGGALEGGILPKLRAAVTAARLGVAAEIGATAVVA